jgi:sarcosine oxidase subunit beta
MRRGNAMRLNGIDAQFLSRDEIAARIPNLDCSKDARFPILGGLPRHRPARCGRSMCVLLTRSAISCNSAKSRVSASNAVRTGVDDARRHRHRRSDRCRRSFEPGRGDGGHPAADRIARAAGDGLRASEAVLDTVGIGRPFTSASLTRASRHGGDLDFYNSYAQRGNLPKIEEVVAACTALFRVSRLR